MKDNIKIKKVKHEYYDLEIKNYKDVLKGTVERRELREIKGVIDNAI